MKLFIFLLIISVSRAQQQSNNEDSNMSTNNRLGVKLLKAFKDNYNGKNFVYSPASLTMGLGMLYYGLGDASRVQIREVLGIRNDETFEKEMLNLGNVSRSQDASFYMGNLIIMDNSSSPLADYVRSVKSVFRASPFIQHFSSSNQDRLVKKVNEWVQVQTNQKISDFLPEGSVDATTRILLINALAFEDSWAEPFQSDFTISDGKFTTESGDVIDNVAMMSNDLNGVRADNALMDGKVTGFVLPFKKSDVVMAIFTSNDGNDENIVNGFTSGYLTDILINYETKLPQKDIRLQMPKLKFGTGTNMIRLLNKIGLTDIFLKNADFSRMTIIEGTENEALYVDSVHHKAIVDVNEEGVSATAATGISVSLYVLFVPELEITLNKPFYFVIFHQSKKEILFIGKVQNPNE